MQNVKFTHRRKKHLTFTHKRNIIIYRQIYKKGMEKQTLEFKPFSGVDTLYYTAFDNFSIAYDV